MNDLYFPAFETGGRIVEVDIIFKKSRIPALLGLSLECMTPGCVPVARLLPTEPLYSALAVSIAAILPTCAMPCVPLHRMQ